MDYSILMLEELQKLEQLSADYKSELRLLSKRIRKDFWRDYNTKKLAYLLNKITSAYQMIFGIIDYFDINCIFEYIDLLAKYCIVMCPHLNGEYYHKLREDIQLENARVIIEKQWDDITSSEDGLKSFIEIFDDVFTNSINSHKDRFFHKLSDTDILCRVVDDKFTINKERFIPLDSSTNNRWNPPGSAFLYLSFSEQNKPYSDDLTLNEYICLEEYRATKGNTYYFCNFRPTKPGNIFDLSYNDVSMKEIHNIIDTHIEDTKSTIINEIMSNSKELDKYKTNKRALKRKIETLQQKHSIDDNILQESFAKQYLKMVCSCIYKRVDETDEGKREKAYKSFHTLALYLESKGVTGIIYPCTRTNTVKGKNLVLFNKYDAEPIEASIREYLYK